MSKPLQPGMMCLIVSHPRSANIGKSVELVQLVKKGDPLHMIDGGAQITSIFDDDATRWVVSGNELLREVNGVEVVGSFAFCAPEWLMLLDGGEDMQETEQQDQPVDIGVMQ